MGYSFLGINEDGNIKHLDPYLDLKEGGGLDYIQAVNALKNQNSKLKTMAVIGGYNEMSRKYSVVAANPALRRNFINSAVALLKKFNFDGLDLDWEYPAQRDSGNPSDKANFVTWLQELRAEFDKYGYLLTIAVGSTSNIADTSYDIPQIAKVVDFIGLMTYDMHGAWDGQTGHNAPIQDSGPFSVDKAVSYWIQKGAPASKLVLGLPSYGQSYTLASASNNGLGASTVGAGRSGPYTGQPGLLGFNEICSDNGWNVVYSDANKSPYAFKGDQWVGFDNERSIGEKINYALSKNLGGVMMWSIETDDFRGDCGPKFPLLSKAYSALNGGGNHPDPVTNKPGPVTPPPVTSAPQTSRPVTSAPPTGNDSCDGRGDGFYRNSADCARYYRCVSGVKYEFSCPAGLKFDSASSVCDYPDVVVC